MEIIRNNEQRLRQVLVFSIVYLVIIIMNLSYHLYQMSGVVNEPLSKFLLFFMNIIAILNFITSIMLVITFIRWFRRAYYNTAIVNKDAVSYANGWASGSWFVPILNLIRPYKIMVEIWIGTINAPKGTRMTAYPHKTIIFWWVTYVISMLINFYGW